MCDQSARISGEVHKDIWQQDPLDIIYLDFAKVFDKVPQKRLLNKMRATWIEDNILQWTES